MYSLTHSLTDAHDQRRVVAISRPTDPGQRRMPCWRVAQSPPPVAAATSVSGDLEVTSSRLPDEHHLRCRLPASVHSERVPLATDGRYDRRESDDGLPPV